MQLLLTGYDLDCCVELKSHYGMRTSYVTSVLCIWSAI